MLDQNAHQAIRLKKNQVEEVSMCTSDRISILETKLVEITGVFEDQHTQNQSTNERNWTDL